MNEVCQPTILHKLLELSTNEYKADEYINSRVKVDFAREITYNTDREII